MTNRAMPEIRNRCGFTLIECLTVIGLVAALIGLLVPAVQDAREAVRRASCQQNLHQIGIGMHGYHDAHGCLPINETNLRITRAKIYFGSYSQTARMLPFLDESVLFNTINFDLGTVPPETPGLNTIPSAELAAANLAYQTVAQSRLGVLICPSDSFGRTGPVNSYRGNTGVGPFYQTDAEFPDSGNGVFPEIGTISIPRITDGLSHTVAFSERLIGSGSVGKPQADRDSFLLNLFVHTADDLLKGCRIASAQPDRENNSFVYCGRWWFWGGRERTLYSHTQSPNGRSVDCTYGGEWTSAGMMTARSWHVGGVNALMCDGSARFIPSSIGSATWRALGTRSGAEPVE